ncbi:MAG TPA: carboxy terminal-processing peptidase [Saprospiraceae bacterium]|nr:carboxy terminal-processing peptidase [Saprospiraceae bacterium]HMP14139.1 carboxy terminal-processing peptidase [Saprospiraceae bacterium]
MKFRKPIFFSVVFITLLVAAFYPRVDNNTQKDAVIIGAILNYLKQLHFQPKPLDDQFSQQVYTLYLDRIDGSRRFLTQEDIKRLENYKNQLDDEARSGDFEFFDLSLDLLNKGMKKVQGYYRDILTEPFDFEKDEKFELDGKKRGFAKNDDELRQYWQRYLKYEVMTRIASEMETQQKTGEESAPKSFEQIEEEARKDVLKLMDDWFGRLAKLKRSNRLSYYLSTITNIFDPHTDYLEPIDKQNFNIRFSGRLEGIGARLQTSGDFTKVNEVVVGGPAWKGQELKEGDIILKVAQGDSPEFVDVAGMQLDDVVQLIRGEKGTKVRLFVKKVDGTTREIAIIRDVVIFEEGFAKSLLLDGVEQGEKIGYVYLPRFYADFENRDGRFSAKDIAVELEKLKSEKVQGIILDLRNNGGGSLHDVVTMSGYFIEKGPIVQVKSRTGQPDVLEDTDPRVQYNGPLIVMVNAFSASASEILAAALQDYGRAVIVGTPTYGKGTVQHFYNLDRGVRGFEDIKPLGEVKLTIQKFYRINGGSTQLRGVTPDIILPDQYQYIEVGERENDYPMEWTQIAPLKYQQNVYKVRNLQKIKAKSEKRIADNNVFQTVEENARRLKAQSEQSAYPLKFSTYLAMAREQELQAKQFDDLFESIVNKGVKNLEVDMPLIHTDEGKKSRNEGFVQSVTKDIYIRETLHIMHDLLREYK